MDISIVVSKGVDYELIAAIALLVFSFLILVWLLVMDARKPISNDGNPMLGQDHDPVTQRSIFYFSVKFEAVVDSEDVSVKVYPHGFDREGFEAVRRKNEFFNDNIATVATFLKSGEKHIWSSPDFDVDRVNVRFKKGNTFPRRWTVVIAITNQFGSYNVTSEVQSGNKIQHFAYDPQQKVILTVSGNF